MEKKKYDDNIKRPTVLLTREQHKEIKIFCAENDIKIQDFLTNAALHALKNKLIPGKKK